MVGHRNSSHSNGRQLMSPGDTNRESETNQSSFALNTNVKPLI